MRDRPGYAAFRSRDFRLFSASRLLSIMALQMQNVAVGWLVYDLTRSAFALGLVGLAAFVPALALVLVTGHVADAFDRRLIMLIAHAATALSAAGLVLFAALGADAALPVYGLVALAGTARAFGLPAQQALLPLLVPREDFGNAVAWNSSVNQTATISGPALGGVLYLLGPTVVFATVAAAFAAAALLAALIVPRPPERRRERTSWTTLVAGLSFIRAHPVVLGAISLDLVAVFLGGATALLPIFAQDILHVGPVGLGLLRSAPAAGALAMAFTLAHRPVARNAGRRMLQAVALFGLSTIGFGLSTSLYLSLACLAAHRRRRHGQRLCPPDPRPDRDAGRDARPRRGGELDLHRRLERARRVRVRHARGAAGRRAGGRHRRRRDDRRRGAVGPDVSPACGARQAHRLTLSLQETSAK